MLIYISNSIIRNVKLRLTIADTLKMVEGDIKFPQITYYPLPLGHPSFYISSTLSAPSCKMMKLQNVGLFSYAIEEMEKLRCMVKNAGVKRDEKWEIRIFNIF